MAVVSWRAADQCTKPRALGLPAKQQRQIGEPHAGPRERVKAPFTQSQSASLCRAVSTRRAGQRDGHPCDQPRASGRAVHSQYHQPRLRSRIDGFPAPSCKLRSGRAAITLGSSDGPAHVGDCDWAESHPAFACSRIASSPLGQVNAVEILSLEYERLHPLDAGPLHAVEHVFPTSCAMSTVGIGSLLADTGHFTFDDEFAPT